VFITNCPWRISCACLQQISHRDLSVYLSEQTGDLLATRIDSQDAGDRTKRPRRLLLTLSDKMRNTVEAAFSIIAGVARLRQSVRRFPTRRWLRECNSPPSRSADPLFTGSLQPSSTRESHAECEASRSGTSTSQSVLMQD